MAVLLFVLAAVCAVASAAPPQQYYNAHTHASLQQAIPLDYYLNANNPGPVHYYNQEQRDGSENRETSSRLENLDPNTEVELVPGVQQPQQPPQQKPVYPTIPGLLPGQRVYILMQGPGGVNYRPLYILSEMPLQNPGYTGYQNSILVDPSGRPLQNPNAFGAQVGPYPFAYQNPYQPIQAGYGLNQLVLQNQPQIAPEEKANGKNNQIQSKKRPSK
ncbi:uncharacterized protein LOC119831428 isoform X2 [Zerene cesonia]|uniref:uncharacterized protein LOC119831428 isoform X2 n=1 Tax=Zerene cesonia TaxID=33412 RepID=UPI0018E4F0C2|nr:uncharacterized protein LOC119831428 isoform X2 [Zerene cesonia]